MNKPLPHQRCVHIETGNMYRVCEYGLGKVNGEWVDVVHYRRIDPVTNLDSHDYPMFTRTVEDFLPKFENEGYAHSSDKS
jgi:hypothetical protein